MDDAFARRDDPETSHEAAATVDTAAMEGNVLQALAQHGKGSTEQIAAWTGCALVTISPRMKPLERKGLVARVGSTRNVSGRRAILWALTPTPK